MNSDTKTIIFGSIIIVIVIIIVAAFFVAIPILTKDTITATVTDKSTYTTTNCYGHGSCSSSIHLMVYTDKEPIEISDSIILWQWGSQQKFGEIQMSKTYKFNVYGFYVPILGMYRSAYDFSEVNS